MAAAGARARFSLVEYGAPVDLCQDIAAIAGMDRNRAAQLLARAGARAANSLGLKHNPIIVDPRGVRAIDFAGIIRLGPTVELEIAPKFLGLDSANSQWREDFFFLATLSKHGQLLANERLAATGGGARDLSTLVARSLVGMYEARKHRPLRSYRRAMEADFFLDGDVDPLDLAFPAPEGFAQEVLRFDRNNPWNAAIQAAAKELLPEVTDPAAIGGLIRMAGHLAPQTMAGAATRKAIPARHHAWQPLHGLALDVIDGLGMHYRAGGAHAPGYLVSTWQAWENLLGIGVRLGFGRDIVAIQKGFPLGTRRKAAPLKQSAISVIPDYCIEANSSHPRMLLDAKYKGHAEKGSLRIAEADIYEALAFSQAATCRLVVLAYPATPLPDTPPPGTCTVFEQVVVGDTRIVGVQVEARAISKVGALKTFGTTLAQQLPAALCG